MVTASSKGSTASKKAAEIKDNANGKFCGPGFQGLLGGPSFDDTAGLRKYSKRLGLALTETMLTTGVTAAVCGHMVFSVGTLTKSSWAFASFGTFMVGCAGVSMIKPMVGVDKDGDKYTENTWHRILCHHMISVGSGMVIAPMVALHPANCVMALGLTGSVSAGMVVYSLSRPRGDLLRWGPTLYSCASGMTVLMLMTAFGSWLFPGLRLGARWIYLLLGLPMFSGLIGFDVNRSLYKYQTLGEADHLGDSVDIYLDMYNLFQVIMQLVNNEERSR